MRSLENSATIYVPTETEEGQKIASQLADHAARLFGGSTMTAGRGRYMKGTQMEVESITLISFSAPRALRRQFAEFIVESAKAIGRNLRQESVAVKLDGELGGYFGLYEAGVDYEVEEVKDVS